MLLWAQMPMLDKTKGNSYFFVLFSLFEGGFQVQNDSLGVCEDIVINSVEQSENPGRERANRCSSFIFSWYSRIPVDFDVSWSIF